MTFLETEDLLPQENGTTSEEEDSYVAPKEKLSFDEKEAVQPNTAVIDLDGDMIEGQEESKEVDDSARSTAEGEEYERMSFLFLIELIHYFFLEISKQHLMLQKK